MKVAKSRAHRDTHGWRLSLNIKAFLFVLVLFLFCFASVFAVVGVFVLLQSCKNMAGKKVYSKERKVYNN